MDFSSQLAASACALPAALLAWRLGGSALDKFFTRKFTVLDDLDSLGPAHARPDDKRIRGTAVICGGRYIGSQSLHLMCSVPDLSLQYSWFVDGARRC